ncbi:MAG: hypothetical protein PHR82_04720 [Endomicrobiaceae bacterium]|nr:hypothetical protein [Endomicrobiaceae bacterium]
MIDIITNQSASLFYLQWPMERLFIEPFYAFSYYLLTMERTGYIFALLSWVVWIIVFVILISQYKKINGKQIIINSIFGILFFLSIVMFVIILPVPGPQLSGANLYKVFDIHSHTMSSKDAIGSVESNIKLHEKHGFTNFFITEHDNVKGFKTIPYNIKNEDFIFPGIQIRTTEGVSVLLLSKKQFSYDYFKEKSIKEIINLAHSKGMLVVMPHWWKWSEPPLQKIVDYGIDGFEIYNCGYRYLTEEKRQSIIDICKKNNLMMFGTIDWHGYGYMTNVWTVVQKQDNKNLFDILKSKPELQVIVHDVKGSQSLIRYIFEPFSAFYYYVVNTEIKYVLSFYMICSVFIALFFYYRIKTLIRIFSLMFSVFFVFATFYYVNMYLYIATQNVVMPGMILPMVSGFSVIWLIIWIINGKNIQS